MSYENIVRALKGGDRRSIGRSNQVVALVRRTPTLFPVLIDCMQHEDELVRMRAADAAEKLTETNPEWLCPFKGRLIKLAAGTQQQELRWHLAQMLPRLALSKRDRVMVLTIFRRYLEDQSQIVKTFSMQGLADLTTQDPRLSSSIRPLLASLIKSGSASMKSRGRKLLAQLRAENGPSSS